MDKPNSPDAPTPKPMGKILDILTHGIEQATTDEHAYMVHCRVAVISEEWKRPIVYGHVRNLANEYGIDMLKQAVEMLEQAATLPIAPPVPVTASYDPLMDVPTRWNGNGWESL